VDVHEVIQDVCAQLRGLTDLRRIRIETAGGDRPSTISGNRPALHRLFLVLLDNAVKYSKVGGKVIVTVQHDQSQITASIEDFGSGIAEADLPHIFERFFRADRARGKGGYGLGLSLADSIVRAHNASIEVRSVEGVGTVFQVTFTSRDATLDVARPGAVSSAI
jgi:signal transduction histidine kinase